MNILYNCEENDYKLLIELVPVVTDGLELELMISGLSGIWSADRKVSAFRILLEKHKKTCVCPLLFEIGDVWMV